MKYKIIADSSCDLTKDYLDNTGIGFSLAPLVITVDGEDFVDSPDLNIIKMLEKMHACKEKSTSSCPSPNSYFEALTGTDKYFIVTISSKLSGSHNAANAAKKMHANPDDVFVIDSKSVGGVMVLIVDKLKSLINQNIPYEEICTQIEEYVNHTHLLFVLNKFDNLVKNGRVSKIKAVIASTFTIKMICEADNGEIKLGKKVLGYNNALKTLVDLVGEKSSNCKDKSCVITYCQNEDVAKDVARDIKKKYDFKKVEVIPMKGLTSFYALEGGIIVGFEI